MVAAERDDPFRVLIACLLSLRTKDETTGPASARLFALADTPHAMLRLTPRQIERAIFPVGFYRTKARVIRGVCRDLIDRFGGQVPDEIDALLTLKGVGRKTANLVVTRASRSPASASTCTCTASRIAGVTSRARNPEETEMALRGRLPAVTGSATTIFSWPSVRTSCQPLSPKCSGVR